MDDWTEADDEMLELYIVLVGVLKLRYNETEQHHDKLAWEVSAWALDKLKKVN